jgi:uncharacterized protein
MNGLIGIAAIVAMLLVAGAVVGILDRKRMSFVWLAIGAFLVLLNDALLTNLYGLLPAAEPDADWNWQGKALAFAASLIIAATAAFGFRRMGLTLSQAKGSLRSAVLVALLYMGFFVAIGLAFDNGPPSAQDIAFQATMPGLEEELFYRGLLLYAFDRAFAGRWRWLGVEWGWSAVFSSALFGLGHAFSYGADGFAFDPITMALTAVPAFLAVWLRLRTGSLLLPILLHNFGNTIGLLI